MNEGNNQLSIINKYLITCEEEDKFDLDLPEKNLVGALLEDTCSVLAKGYSDLKSLGYIRSDDYYDKERVLEAIRWLLDESDHVYSFIFCCEVLDICPIKLRKYIYNKLIK